MRRTLCTYTFNVSFMILDRTALLKISTVKCLMENSDLITRTSYGKNTGENTSKYRTSYTGIQAQ